jgi:hypothetical protein
MPTAARGFWSGREGLGRHFWLYFVLPIAVLTGIGDFLYLFDLSSSDAHVIHAALFTAAAFVAIVAAGPLFASIIRSNKGLVWKILVAAITLLATATTIRLAYESISRVQ